MPDPKFSPASHFIPMGQLKKGKKLTKAQLTKIEKEQAIPSTPTRLPNPNAERSRPKSTAVRAFVPRDIGDYISILAICPGYPTTEIAKMKAYAPNTSGLEALAEYMELSGHHDPINPHVGKAPTSRNIYAREYLSGNKDPDLIVTKIFKELQSRNRAKTKPWANHIVFATGLRGEGPKEVALVESIQERLEFHFSHINFYHIALNDDYTYEDLTLLKLQRHIRSWRLMATFLDMLDWPLTDTHLDEGVDVINRAITADLRELPCGEHFEEREEENAQKAQARDEGRLAKAKERPQSTARVRLRPPRS